MSRLPTVVFEVTMSSRSSQTARSSAFRLVVATLAAVCVTAHSSALLAQIPACQATAAPAASFSATCSGASCTFTATAPSGSDLEWDFGDGTFVDGSALSVSHTYSANGYYVVTLTLTTPDGQVAVATGAVTIGGAPVHLASDDAFTTTQNTPLTISIAVLLSNDAPGVTLYQISSRCPLSADGSSCTYTPPSGFLGTDSFTYSVTDSGGNIGSATVTITIIQPLVANPDSFSTGVGVPILITSSQLLANDTPGAVFVSAENPDKGTLTYVQTTAQGAQYRFTPTASIGGIASFDYLISRDGNPPYVRGFVYINIVDAPPHAQFVTSCVNRTCTVHSRSYDDIGIQTWQWNWGDGTPTITPTTPYPWADQTHTYAASGRYTITHTVIDTSGQSDSTTLAVLADTPPVAVNDSATTDRNVPVTINVLSNDSDPDGDPLSIGTVDLHNYLGADARVVPVGNSWALRITPPNTFVGTMTFTYDALDPWGLSATATVTLVVKEWTMIVAAVGDQFYCAQNGSLRLPPAALLANDYDSNGDPLTIVARDTSILMGTLDCTTNPTECKYTPPSNAAGFTLFRYTISDPAGHQDSATVRIYVGYPDSAPVATEVFFTTPYNTPKTFTIQDLQQNDIDPDSDVTTVGLQSMATDFGSLSCSTPTYRCTYTPNPGFVGTDRFSYSAWDMINPPSYAGINMLTLPPTTPTFDAREVVLTTDVNQQAYFSKAYLTSNAYAPNGGPLTVTAIDTTGLLGSLTCDSSACTYNPPSYFQGATHFKYTASDSHGATDTAVVKILVGTTHPPPVANPVTLSTPKNTPLRFSVFELLRNDYDPNNDPLTVTVYAFNAQLGSLDCGSSNYWCVYTPHANATGSDALTYQLSNGTNGASSTVTINITP
ncbi:MAG TPA: Ig-like domain-containing protein [Thermoanaerobaculia bacterium]|nr:Ig-like domain-containing protein [Thermoanaerobaculia bacterium]